MELYKLTIILLDIILIILSITTIKRQQGDMRECRMRWLFDSSNKSDWGTWIQDITLILNAMFIIYLAIEVIDWNYKIPIF